MRACPVTLFFPIEPPIGAAVLLALYRRYGDLWLVELLFNDLLRWNDWFLEERTCDATNLTCLGSWNQLTQYNDGQVCSSARACRAHASPSWPFFFFTALCM